MTGTWAFLDLDGTVVFSRRAAAEVSGSSVDDPAWICVDRSGDVDVGWALRSVVEILREVSLTGRLVPTTARSIAQLNRMELQDRATPYAIVDNGAVILASGHPDAEWDAHVSEKMSSESVPFEEIGLAMRAHSPIERDGRILVLSESDVERALRAEDLVRDTCAALGWRAERDGRRVYISPASVSKAAAADWVAERVGARRTIAAGDSQLDRGLLEWADESAMPGHSPLASEQISSTEATANMVRVLPVSGGAASLALSQWIAQTVVEM